MLSSSTRVTLAPYSSTSGETVFRKALNKAEAAKLKMQDRMEDDRRKLKLANHVIKEMKKIADTGPNKSHSKGKSTSQK